MTYNLGCGGPHATTRADAALQWATAARDRYDLVFAQEVPSDAWLDAWRGTHHVTSVASPRYRVRSALIVGKALKISSMDFSTAHYHDSYVAAASVTFPDNREVTCASVHASPSFVTDDWRRLWEECGEPFPTARDGADLWDSDLLLATVSKLSVGRSILVAGDWNEARAWDGTHPGTSGAQFFQRLTDQHLIDCTWEAWNCEESTCTPTFGVSLQVDHVIATPDVARSVREPRVLSEGPDAGGSDHFPIDFTIDLDLLG